MRSGEVLSLLMFTRERHRFTGQSSGNQAGFLQQMANRWSPPGFWGQNYAGSDNDLHLLAPPRLKRVPGGCLFSFKPCISLANLCMNLEVPPSLFH